MTICWRIDYRSAVGLVVWQSRARISTAADCGDQTLTPEIQQAADRHFAEG